MEMEYRIHVIITNTTLNNLVEKVTEKLGNSAIKYFDIDCNRLPDDIVLSGYIRVAKSMMEYKGYDKIMEPEDYE